MKVTCRLRWQVVKSYYIEEKEETMSEFGWILIEVVIFVVCIGMYGFSRVEKIVDDEEY